MGLIILIQKITVLYLIFRFNWYPVFFLATLGGGKKVNQKMQSTIVKFPSTSKTRAQLGMSGSGGIYTHKGREINFTWREGEEEPGLFPWRRWLLNWDLTNEVFAQGGQRTLGLYWLSLLSSLPVCSKFILFTYHTLLDKVSVGLILGQGLGVRASSLYYLSPRTLLPLYSLEFSSLLTSIPCYSSEFFY